MKFNGKVAFYKSVLLSERSERKGQRTAEPQLCRKGPRAPEAKLGWRSIYMQSEHKMLKKPTKDGSKQSDLEK